MTDLKICSHTSIRNHSISVNGETGFSASNEDSAIGFFKAAYRHYGIKYGKFFKMDALSKLGFLAAELMLSPHRIEKEGGFHYGIQPDETAVVLYNAAASLHTDAKYQKTVADIPSPAVFVYTLPNILIGEICIRNNFKGESTFFIEKKFDIPQTEHYIRLLFDTTNIRQCLTGWVEMSMNGDYEAVLYLISKEKGEIDFTPSNLQHIFSKG